MTETPKKEISDESAQVLFLCDLIAAVIGAAAKALNADSEAICKSLLHLLLSTIAQAAPGVDEFKGNYASLKSMMDELADHLIERMPALIEKLDKAKAAFDKVNKPS